MLSLCAFSAKCKARFDIHTHPPQSAYSAQLSSCSCSQTRSNETKAARCDAIGKLKRTAIFVYTQTLFACYEEKAESPSGVNSLLLTRCNYKVPCVLHALYYPGHCHCALLRWPTSSFSSLSSPLHVVILARCIVLVCNASEAVQQTDVQSQLRLLLLLLLLVYYAIQTFALRTQWRAQCDTHWSIYAHVHLHLYLLRIIHTLQLVYSACEIRNCTPNYCPFERLNLSWITVATIRLKTRFSLCSIQLP